VEIETLEANRMPLAKFADQHGLTMQIGERTKTFYCGPDFENARFYARFKDCEVADDHVLRGVFGNGSTPERAMDAYAKEISGQKLVVAAYTPQRREIYAPELF
jgi:hypothetical protein